jgi:hypothetical protein
VFANRVTIQRGKCSFPKIIINKKWAKKVLILFKLK